MEQIATRVLVILSILGSTFGVEEDCSRARMLSNTKRCPNINLMSREEWGGKKPKYCTKIPPVGQVFITHTATNFCDTTAKCSDLVRKIQKYHMDNNQWHDIGYQWLIGGDGKVYEGVNWNIEGAHTYKCNYKAISICFIGNFNKQQPTQKMFDAAKELLKCGVKHGYLDPNYTVHGHRDAIATSSPGENLYKIMKTWPNYGGKTTCP